MLKADKQRINDRRNKNIVGLLKYLTNPKTCKNESELSEYYQQRLNSMQQLKSKPMSFALQTNEFLL